MPRSVPSLRVRIVGLASLMLACILPFAQGGCRASTSPYRSPSEGARDTTRAERLNREAANAMEASSWTDAKSFLHDALVADLYFGPAHNNLGIIHMREGNAYEAASEFEWARKLMPGHPDPRVNLAIVLELVGKPAEALAAYRSALEVYPEHIGATQGLVRLQLRQAKTDDTTRHMLQQVALQGETAQWQEWARLELAKRSNGTTVSDGRLPP